MLRGFSLGVALSFAVTGCDLGPDEILPGPPEPYAMTGFSWVVGDSLAGMPRPGGRGALDSDLAFVAAQGVDLLVSLVEDDAVVAAAARRGLEVKHIPVRDFTAPTMMQLREFTAAAHAAMADDKAVGVHCGAGLGRTGTFLSAYFVSKGMSADDAIAHVRALRPGSVETAAQVEAVRQYASRSQAEPSTSAPPASADR